MTALLVILDAALTLAGGAVLTGLIRTRLTVAERALIGLVSGLLLSSAVTYVLSLLAGLSTGTVIGGPLIVLGAALVASLLTVDPRAAWYGSWVESRDGWSQHIPWFSMAALVAGIAIVTAIFAHTVYSDPGGLEAGYPTVWADWSQHLTTASSFAVGGNVPPVNPLFSGTSLLYPFLPDFHAATLMTLGLSPGLALAIPGGVLVVVIGMLVVALGRRLGLGTGAGVVALLICFIGGGVGFVGLFADACTSHGFTATQCTFQYAIAHPGSGLSIAGWTLHDLPGTIAAQPRAYDGLPSDGGPAPFANMQWYTPLMAWWLPQRTLLFGFAAALSVLLLVLAGASSGGRSWEAFILAGLLVGLLPIVHVQTLIALALLLLVLLWRRRRREWVALAAIALAVGGLRLAQLVLAKHGSPVGPYGTDVYPWLEPGWLANVGTGGNPSGRLDFSIGNLFAGAIQAVGMIGTASWWAFWLANLGVAVPLIAVVAAAVVARWFGGTAQRVGRVLTSAFPVPLLELAVGALVIFAACNLVVFQTWNWDNTKLLVYWYLVIALLIGALAAHWWRRAWPRVAAIALVLPVVLTGTLVVLRLLPWTPSAQAIAGPYTIASTQELQLAAAVERDTPKGAVVLTFGRPNDPVLAVAGRIGVMGYGGWLWSYGIDIGTRYADVQTLYAGCATDAATCPIPALLRRYGISYVEIDNRLNDPGAVDSQAGLTWWADQGFPVVARTDHIIIYDVRGRT